MPSWEFQTTIETFQMRYNILSQAASKLSEVKIDIETSNKSPFIEQIPQF